MLKTMLSFMMVVSAPSFGAPALTYTQPASVESSSMAIVENVNANLSQNWSGYAADSAGQYTGVGATWDIPSPSLSEAPLSTDATWVGIGGILTNDLIQAGTQAIIQNGHIQYEAWYELLPGDQVIIPIEVNGGDSVTVALTNLSGDTWHLSFRDTTTGGDYETNLTYASSLSSAEWIEEMPLSEDGNAVGFLPLDDFGTVTFTDAYTIANGVRETIEGSGAHEIIMAADHGQVSLATPSSLASDDSFSIARSSDTETTSVPQIQYEAAPTITYSYGGGRGEHRFAGYGRRQMVVITLP